MQTEVATTDESTTDETTGKTATLTAPAASGPRALRQTARAVSALGLDLEKVAEVEGLTEEVALLRASIRRLARPDGETAEHVRVLAELRHQVEALCTTLKTQQALDGNSDARSADLARILDDLGDHLGVPR
jgi:hypothetical protein